MHTDRGVAAGKGDLDYHQLVTLAAQHTPHAPLVLEYVGAADYQPALAHLRAWLRALPGPWTLHQLTLDATGALAAILRADRPLQPPAGMTLRELPDAPRLAFPVNDALLAWPQTWLPAPLAMRTLSDGLWLAGLTPPVPADAPTTF